MDRNNNLFRITFLISLIIHAVFFLPMPQLNKPKQQETNKLYLNYLTLKIPAKKRVARFKHKKIDLENKAKIQDQKNLDISSDDAIAKNSVPENKSVEPLSDQINTKQNIEMSERSKQIITTTKTADANALLQDKSYISYYRLINEQLRQAVIYPPQFSEGEISLSFVLDSDGKLRNVEVIESTSPEDEILKETAMQIVKKAAPFPPFPKNLQHKQLTFNIIFCFKESS